MATTTPNYGWDVPTSTDYVKDGATAIETLGDDIDATLYTALGGAYPGLRLVKTQTIGTAVSTVTVTDAFSATYNHYKILLIGGTASASSSLNLKIGNASTGYYAGIFAIRWDGTTQGLGQSNTAFLTLGTTAASGNQLDLTIGNPFNTSATTIYGQAVWMQTAATGFNRTVGGYLNNTNSYTSFTLAVGSGTITGGTIYVYGYGAS